MKITISKLQGSNVLAYGDFELQMDGEKVYQLVGKNGCGKSSLPTILEEVLFNSNSRGLKKAKLENRKTDIKGWWGQVDFSIDSDVYVVRKTVKTSSKVTFTKNGEDCSGHTATQTYKLIKEVLGDLDFKTFSKLVYQSMKSSLDFLEATDTARKNFLTTFLGLEKYGLIAVELKAEVSELKEIEDSVQVDISRLSTLLASANKLELLVCEKSLIAIPDQTKELQDIADQKVANDKFIEETIRHNENVKNELSEYRRNTQLIQKYDKQEAVVTTKKDELALALDLEAVTIDESAFDTSRLADARKELAETNQLQAVAKRNYKRYKDEAEVTECHACHQSLDTSTQQGLVEQYKQEFSGYLPTRKALEAEVSELELLQTQLSALKDKKKRVESKQNSAKVAVERAEEVLSSMERPEPIEQQDLQERSRTAYDTANRELDSEVKSLGQELRRIERNNSEVAVEEATVDTNNDHYHTAQKDLLVLKKELATSTATYKEAQVRRAKLATLVEAFGPKGIIGYKIESSVKVFEGLINKYLSIFTGGQFALTFRLDGAKLSVVVYDDGEETEMVALSSGESAKVNISTLLAIRNLMGSVSKINMNTLFLDEVVSVLDTESRDTLVDILLEEEGLNTFLVSHEYTHPLTKTLTIKKEGLESKIYGG